MHWPLRPPTRAPSRPVPVPAAVAMLAADTYADRPFGGHDGESLPEAAAAPAPPPPQPLEIPPPPWAGREGDIDLDRDDVLHGGHSEPDTSRTSAVAEMLSEDAKWPEPVLEPLVDPPLVRPSIPPADWRREEVERALQAGGPPIEKLECERSLESRPARRGAKT